MYKKINKKPLGLLTQSKMFYLPPAEPNENWMERSTNTSNPDDNEENLHVNAYMGSSIGIPLGKVIKVINKDGSIIYENEIKYCRQIPQELLPYTNDNIPIPSINSRHCEIYRNTAAQQGFRILTQPEGAVPGRPPIGWHGNRNLENVRHMNISYGTQH